MRRECLFSAYIRYCNRSIFSRCFWISGSAALCDSCFPGCGIEVSKFYFGPRLDDQFDSVRLRIDVLAPPTANRSPSPSSSPPASTSATKRKSPSPKSSPQPSAPASQLSERNARNPPHGLAIVN